MTGKKRIEKKFTDLRERGEKGLITYITAGYPSMEYTLEILKTLADCGSDLIEIGIPFSDPIADGQVIQNSSYQSLSGGTRLKDIFDLACKLRGYTDIPLLFMTYYNPVLKAGIDNFAGSAAGSGVDGLIVPDLPVEEDEKLKKGLYMLGMSLIPLVAPTSTNGRLKKIASRDDGFIYCVSVAGVTGSTEDIKTDLKYFAGRVREYTCQPLAVGFGISRPGMAVKTGADFDAVVVGSAIVRSIDGGGGLGGILNRVRKTAGDIRAALRR